MTGLILGIDPGKTGAIAVLDTDGRLLDVVDMPDVTGAALGAEVRMLLDDLAPHTVEVAWVERVGGRPGEGASRAFAFGAGWGGLLGALGALSVRVELVAPSAWKARMRLTKDKAACRQRAMERWPADAERFRRIKDDGRAEAALIALYGWEADR